MHKTSVATNVSLKKQMQTNFTKLLGEPLEQAWGYIRMHRGRRRGKVPLHERTLFPAYTPHLAPSWIPPIISNIKHHLSQQPGQRALNLSLGAPLDNQFIDDSSQFHCTKLMQWLNYTLFLLSIHSDFSVGRLYNNEHPSCFACGVSVCLCINHLFLPHFPERFPSTSLTARSSFKKWIWCTTATEGFNPLCANWNYQYLLECLEATPRYCPFSPFLCIVLVLWASSSEFIPKALKDWALCSDSSLALTWPEPSSFLLLQAELTSSSY